MDLHELATRDGIGLVIDHMGLRRGVEVGVAFGENAETILSGSTMEALYLVDPWAYVPGEDPAGFADAIKDWDGCFEYCKRKMERFGDRARIIRASSAEASEMFEDGSLDFVYIDANHMRPYIDNDLRLWYLKVRTGGIFGGHDYHKVNTANYQCGVKDAVDEFLAGHHIHVTSIDSDPSWYIIK